MAVLCRAITRVLGVVLCVLMATTVITVLWQVATRFYSKFAVEAQASQGTEELAGFLLGWVALLGAVYVYAHRGHLTFDLLYSTHSENTRRRLDILSYVLEILFSLAVFVFGGGRLVYMTLSYGQTTAVLRWPMGMVYCVLPVSGILLTLYGINFIIRRSRGESPVMVSATGGAE